MVACNWLLQYSTLQYFKVLPSIGAYYLYDSCRGVYVKLSFDELLFVTREVLSYLKDDRFISYDYVRCVVRNIVISDHCVLGQPLFDKDYVVFTNGVLHLPSGEFSANSPKHFVLTNLGFPYNVSQDCPLFLSFLRDFCKEYEDRMLFIRAWFKALIHKRVDFQVFLVLLGPAATGKSTLASIATALIGKDSTITTSLKSLHRDNLKLINLIGKEHILISESEMYSGDLEILKQIVGQDTLRGRVKYVQGSF